MNIASIEKAIKLLSDGQLGALRELLLFEREKEILKSKGKTPTLLETVKKVIDKADKKDLRAVLIDEDGIQWVCNGYILVKWNEYQSELHCIVKENN